MKHLAATASASFRLCKVTQLNHFKFVSLIAVAAGSMFLAQASGASTPVFIADASMGMKSKRTDAAAIVHRGTGTVRKIDTGMVTLSHGPIASLNWPAMTMSFKLKGAALAKGIKVGDVVDFELVQSGDNYVVTRLSIK